jgi:hypothetical protein
MTEAQAFLGKVRDAIDDPIDQRLCGIGAETFEPHRPIGFSRSPLVSRSAAASPREARSDLASL